MIIKCVLFILVFLFVIYRIGIILGKILKNKNKIFNFLYGFLMLISINQILLTPCIMLHTSFNLAFYLVLIVDLLLVGISFFIKNKFNNKFKKSQIFLTSLVCICVIFQIVLTTITYKSNADDSFYVSLSTTNIDSEAIYKEEPSMGYKTGENLLSAVEQIPTIELQIAIWSKLFNINPAIICHSLIPAIIIFIAYLSYYYFAKIFFNDKYSKIFLIFLSIIFLFTGFSTRFRPGYLLTRTWQGKTIFLSIGLTMVLSALIKMDKKVKFENIIILFISNLCSIALSSTAIFIIPFAYLGFGILKLIKLKWKDILYLIISFIPVIIYIVVFFILTRTSKDGFSVPTDEVSIIESLKFYKNKAYLIYYLVSTIIIMFIGNKTAKRYYCYIQIINLITIWNPLFSNIIAKYFTSSATFWRVLWLLPIEFAISYCIVQILKKIKNDKIKVVTAIISIVILIIPGKFVYSFNFTDNLENIPQFILNQTNYILENDEDKEEIVVLAPPEPLHSCTMRQLSSKIKLICSRDAYIGKLKNEIAISERSNLQQIYNNIYKYDTEDFNDLIEKYNIDWIIVSKDDIDLIEYIEKTIMVKNCEIDGYVLYNN